MITFGAIIDTWNVSVYTHTYIMDIINTTPPHLKSQKIGVELLISERTGSVLDYPVPRKTFLLLPTYLLNIKLSTTQTFSQIKPQEVIGHTLQHFMTGSLTYLNNDIQDLVKCCIKRWVLLDLRPVNMLFGGVQPIER